MNEFKATNKWYLQAAESETGHDLMAGSEFDSKHLSRENLGNNEKDEKYIQ